MLKNAPEPYLRTVLMLLLLVACVATHAHSVYDLEGNPVNPFTPRTNLVRVFIFLATDCPIANQSAPDIQRVHLEFKDRVDFWLVYANRDETADTIRRRLRDYGHEAAALRDPHHVLVRKSKVRVTPEAAVFKGEKLVYHGRINDRFVDFGKKRPQATTHDLREAIQAILAGKEPAQAETKAIGCYIPEPP